MRVTGRISSLILVLLAGCTVLPTDAPSIDTTYCDPYERKDCYALSAETMNTFAEIATDNDTLRAALRFCQKHEAKK